LRRKRDTSNLDAYRSDERTKHQLTENGEWKRPLGHGSMERNWNDDIGTRTTGRGRREPNGQSDLIKGVVIN